jgi:hypothetical protein
MPPLAMSRPLASRGSAKRFCSGFWKRKPTMPVGMVPTMSSQASRSSP